MFKYLFLAFTLIELYLLLFIGREIGFGPTLAIVLATGLLGALLAKKEGLRVLRRWQQSIAQGRIPEEGLLGGVLVLVGGVLLVAPGVLTDATGLLLLFPPTRKVVAGLVRRTLERGMTDGTLRVTPFGAPPRDEPFADRPSQPRMERWPGDEVDAEFTEEDGPGRG